MENLQTENIDPETIRNHLRERLKDCPQTSWDWEADLAFAKLLGDKKAIEALELIIKGNAPSGLRMMAHDNYARSIKEKRLKHLRALVAKGEATAGWEGLGQGGRSQFGVNRVRVFSLVEKRG